MYIFGIHVKDQELYYNYGVIQQTDKKAEVKRRTCTNQKTEASLVPLSLLSLSKAVLFSFISSLTLSSSSFTLSCNILILLVDSFSLTGLRALEEEYRLYNEDEVAV